MNIYNFIFCYFYIFWQKRNGDGKFSAVMHVFFAMLIHVLLITEIFEDLTGLQIFHIPRLGNYGESKMKYMLFCIPIIALIYFYYNRERTKNLLKYYSEEYKTDKNGLKVIIYIIIPTILVILLAIFRQNGYME